jgi:hypothetical protein
MDNSAFGLKWWTDEEKAHGSVMAIVKALGDQSLIRSQQNLRMARLYGNSDILGLAPSEYFRTSQPLSMTNRITLNVIKSAIDTISSRIAKHKPRPVFLTSDGEWELQQKAKKLNRFMQGVFYETNFYELGATVFRDACIFGTGIIKAYTKNGRICFERVLSEEIIVDSAEAVYGRPQSLFQRKQINRSVLLEKYGKDEKMKAAILVAPNSATTTNEQLIADMVEVIEAWHLPSGPKAKDGKHLICIQGATLFSESYKKHKFPFLWYQWTPPVVGFFGQGLSEELVGIQLEINKLLRQIQLSQHLLSTPKVFLENNSQVVSAHINNDIGAIIRYTGTAPQVHAFQTVHPEIYQHLERLYSKAYEIAGVSQLAAQSLKPAGLDSGRALREFSDIESERFALAQQRYEQMSVDATMLAIELAKELVESGFEFKVKSPNKKVIEEINFKEVDLDESTYILQCFPTNFLPVTPAGRLQSVQELMTAGLIDRETGLALLDFPDLEGAMSLANAAYDDAMMAIERILFHGEYNPPEAMSNLQLCLRLGQASYLKAKVQKVPAERLDLLSRWVDDCLRLMQEAVAATAPPPALENGNQPPEAAPPAAPNMPAIPGGPVV